MPEANKRARLVDKGDLTLWELKEWVDALLQQQDFGPNQLVRIGRARANPFMGVLIVEEPNA